MNTYAAYRTVDNNVDEDNKPKLLLKVFQNILDRISFVRAAIEHNDYERKYSELSRIKMLLEILDSSLDMSYGEIPQNLSSLYRYIIQRLEEVHRTCDIDILEECKRLIGNIHEGFTHVYESETRGKSAVQEKTSRNTFSTAQISI